METQVAKWGNSLALRVPAAFAREVQIEEGTPVELTIEDGRLVVTPRSPAYSLDELLADVTEQNRHDETDWGPAVGAEGW